MAPTFVVPLAASFYIDTSICLLGGGDTFSLYYVLCALDNIKIEGC